MLEEKIRTEEQIRLLENEVNGIKEPNPSLDDMWDIIEKFGIKRESLDPRDKLSYEEVYSLYLSIKNHNSSTEGNKINL